ncbi:LysE family transporter [Undibacterium sp. TS12]|uniref:LysE family translocator n=1 Tax=Undibacterium sp. TS12 TaxID=2908202 RepID=UPI001F4D1E97|nr:LysE family transporter [Undibacterium sp. TS12]MCH8621577.1 LysE family transporter [Undibacterium sp. TS12]
MSVNTWLLYVFAVLVLTITPGPAVLMCITNSINFGSRMTMFPALGNITSLIAIMSCSAIGLGAILATSALVFTVIKYLGVAYLLYLGISSLRSKSTDFVLPTETDMRGTRLRLYVKGMLVGASNPKALLFFTAFFPQFINPAAAKLPQFLVLGSTFVFFEFSVLMLYAVFAARLGPWLRSRGKARMFNQVSGGIFVGAAALLATVKRAHTD